jgi:hypothetical protein
MTGAMARQERQRLAVELAQHQVGRRRAERRLRPDRARMGQTVNMVDTAAADHR